MSLEFKQGPPTHPAFDPSVDARYSRVIMWTVPLPGVGLLLLGAPKVAAPYLVAFVALIALVYPALALEPLPPFIGGLLLFSAYLHLMQKAMERGERKFAEDILIDRFLVDAEQERATPGGDRCPRCGIEPRTPAGWCSSCLAVLPDWTQGRALLELMVDAANRAADRETKRYWDFPYVAHSAGGAEIEVSRSMHEQLGSFLRQGFPGISSTVESAFAEPDDPEILWACTDVVGEARDGRRLEARRVTKHRIVDGRITEIWQYPLL